MNTLITQTNSFSLLKFELSMFHCIMLNKPFLIEVAFEPCNICQQNEARDDVTSSLFRFCQADIIDDYSCPG